mgnify:CR=1 FL=1
MILNESIIRIKRNVMRQESERFGSLGAIVSAVICASCFPVLVSLGATLGLGFLAQFEGVFINTLLPVFAGITFASAFISWVSHKQHFRGVLSITGPLMVFATLYMFWANEWSTYMFYIALALMFAVSVFDLVLPPVKSCQAPVPSSVGINHE